DEERGEWEGKTGMRVRRYPWWHDGDQDFLAEWVDPSRELDFRRCHALRHELFEPLVRGIAKSFAYDGPAPEYFRHAIDEQIGLLSPDRAARTLALDHLWRTVVDAAGPTIDGDHAFAAFSRAARAEALGSVDEPVIHAVVDTPR